MPPRGPYCDIRGIRYDLTDPQEVAMARDALCAAGERTSRVYTSEGQPTRRMLRATSWVELDRNPDRKDPRSE